MSDATKLRARETGFSDVMREKLRSIRGATGRARPGEHGYSADQKPTQAYKPPKIGNKSALTAHQRKADAASK